MMRVAIDADALPEISSRTVVRQKATAFFFSRKPNDLAIRHRKILFYLTFFNILAIDNDYQSHSKTLPIR